MGYFKRRSILFLLPIALIALIIGTSYPVMASGGATDPIEVIPGNMDFVFIGDFSKDPALNEILDYVLRNENEFAPVLKTEILYAGRASSLKNYMPFDYFAAKVSKSSFEEFLQFAKNEEGELIVKNDPYTYYCDQDSQCFSLLGGYLYSTPDEKRMRDLLSNFYKKSRGTLSQNPGFLTARATAFSEGELFFYATSKFIDELTSSGVNEDDLSYYGYNETFSQMTDFISSLKFISVSIAIYDKQLQVRVFEQLDESVLKTLGIALKDYMFKPHLYTFFDPSTLLMFTENHNFAGKIKLLEERLLSDIALPPSGQPYIELVKKLGEGYALGISKNSGDSLVPAFHFIAEIKPNDARAIRTLLDEIFTLTKAALDEKRSEDDSLQYSFVTNPDDTYTFSMAVQEEELKTMLGTVFNLNFGLDNGYLFLSTLTDKASAKKYAYSDKLRRLFGNSPAMQGLFYLDFKNVNSTVNGILTALNESFGFSQTAENEVFANTFGLLDSMIVKSFSTDDSIAADFILTLQEDATFTALMETIIGFIQTTEEEELYEHDSYYNSPFGRDLQRVAGLSDMALALELYYQDTGKYPLEGSGNIPPDVLSPYFESNEIPGDPLRERTVFDGGIGGKYWYKACDSGEGYLLLANTEDPKTAEDYYDIPKEPLANDCKTLTSLSESTGSENTKYGIFNPFGR